MPTAATKPVNPPEAFTAGDRVVHRRSLNLGTVEGDTSGAWNAVFVRWVNGDAGMVRPYDLRLADGYVVSAFAPTPAMVPQVCQQQQADAGAAILPATMHREAYVQAVRAAITAKGYPWAQDPERLNKVITSVRRMLAEGTRAVTLEGSMIEAWRAIGGKGKPTYKALHALPVREPITQISAPAPDMLTAGKHLAVKLAEAYRAAGINPADCQAIRDWMTVVAQTEKAAA